MLLFYCLTNEVIPENSTSRISRPSGKKCMPPVDSVSVCRAFPGHVKGMMSLDSHGNKALKIYVKFLFPTVRHFYEELCANIALSSCHNHRVAWIQKPVLCLARNIGSSAHFDLEFLLHLLVFYWVTVADYLYFCVAGKMAPLLVNQFHWFMTWLEFIECMCRNWLKQTKL